MSQNNASFHHHWIEYLSNLQEMCDLWASTWVGGVLLSSPHCHPLTTDRPRLTFRLSNNNGHWLHFWRISHFSLVYWVYTVFVYDLTRLFITMIKWLMHLFRSTAFTGHRCCPIFSMFLEMTYSSEIEPTIGSFQNVLLYETHPRRPTAGFFIGYCIPKLPTSPMHHL